MCNLQWHPPSHRQSALNSDNIIDWFYQYIRNRFLWSYTWNFDQEKSAAPNSGHQRSGYGYKISLFCVCVCPLIVNALTSELLWDFGTPLAGLVHIHFVLSCDVTVWCHDVTWHGCMENVMMAPEGCQRSGIFMIHCYNHRGRAETAYRQACPSCSRQHF